MLRHYWTKMVRFPGPLFFFFFFSSFFIKEPSLIFSTFFQTFGDFAITRKLMFCLNSWQILKRKTVLFGRYR